MSNNNTPTAPETIATITADDNEIRIQIGGRWATLPRDSRHFETMLTGYLHDMRRGLLALKKEPR